VGCVYALLQGRAEMDFNRWTSMSGTTSEYTQYDVVPDGSDLLFGKYKRSGYGCTRQES